jgi:O-antigen ligase
LVVAATTLGAVALASAAWSVDPGLTLRRAATFGVLLWVALVVVPIHAGEAIERRRLAVCLAILCVAGAAAAVVAAVAAPWLAKSTPGAFAYSNGLPAVPRIGPLQGWLESPNTLGLWCALLVPFTLTLRSRAVAIPCVLLAVGVILWSYSRAALIVLLLALAWQVRPLVSRRMAIAVAVLVAAIAVGPARSTVSTNTALTKFQRAGSNERSLLGGRLEAWNASLDLIEAAPLSGFGFGTGDRLFKLSGADRRFIYYIGSNPSSGYLQALEEVGPLGAIAMLAALTAGLMAGWRRRRYNGGGMPFLVVGFSFAIIGLTESIFTSPGSPFALLLWSSLALASAGVPSSALPLRSGPAPGDGEVVARQVRLAAETISEEPVVAPNGRRAEPRHAPSRDSPGVRN